MARILICERHDLVRALLREILTEAGHEVVLRDSEAEVLGSLDGQVDLVVTSARLADGVEANELIRTLRERGLHQPVLVTTGNPWDHAVPQDPAAQVLPKPFTPQELLRAIAQLLGQSGPRY
jgi:CheY-like chemotaxis protein